MKVTRKRGSTSVTFIFGEKTRAAKVRAIKKYRGNIIKYLSYKNRRSTKHVQIAQDIVYEIRHGYADSTIKKNQDDDSYYSMRKSANFFVIDLERKPTPVGITNYAAYIIENYEEILRGKNAEFPDAEHYELPTDIRIYSITIIWLYPKIKK